MKVISSVQVFIVLGTKKTKEASLIRIMVVLDTLCWRAICAILMPRWRIYIYLKILFNINNINDKSVGVVRQMLTRLTMAIICWIYAAQSCCHSKGAASRWTLNISLEFSRCSLLKWLKTEEWIASNFCKLYMCRKRSIAYSRRRNWRWELSHLLFFYRPASYSSWFSITFMAAL